MSTILAASEDAARIVHRLRGFYRTEEEEERLPVDLNQLIEQAVSWTRPRWQTTATAAGRTLTVTAQPGEIPCVARRRRRAAEALTNLIFNAVDALPQGGAITLCTRAEADAVVLTISDNGTGMSEEVRQRCLEPFFTTKGESGTGLGLSMVFGIIHRHGGTIDIASEVGKGTTFTLRLPLSPDEMARGPRSRRRSSVPSAYWSWMTSRFLAG